VEPEDIFRLIVKADERLKYATSGGADLRIRQARDLLTKALTEARAIGSDALVAQVEQRLADLDHLPPTTGSSG
jgi:hypothetical protein